jgi:HD-GYP domain-containing protein (c-di-GMP phosphodiesterase class II)
VGLAALLQDIGTLGVPARFLNKPDILTVEEMAAVQYHPTHARELLSEIPGFGRVSWWVGAHHERIDGKGYPAMLEGEEVPVEAQVIGMCDAYEALTSDRPHRRAISPGDALQIIRGLAESRFESYLVGIFEGQIDHLVDR